MMVTDYNGEATYSAFYEQESQKTKQEVYGTEKTTRKRESKSLAKWFVYPELFHM